MEIIHFDTIDSTNAYCELLDLDQVEEFAIVIADEQTAGRGQQDHTWASETGKNLTFSLILHPSFLSVRDQYMITKVLSLALCDYLGHQLGVPATIKWPNDIYIGTKKICGMLVANKLKKNQLSTCICGIGLNVNQTSFPDWVPNPTSMSLLSGYEFNTNAELELLIHYIQNRYDQLQDGAVTQLDNDYLSKLMNMGKEVQYLYDGQAITARILGVNCYGHLILETDCSKILTCQMGEVSLVL